MARDETVAVIGREERERDGKRKKRSHRKMNRLLYIISLSTATRPYYCYCVIDTHTHV